MEFTATFDWINPTATLVASFAGAWAAFKLQSIEKARDTRQTNVTAVNRVLATLMQQANTLKLYQKDHIDPVRDHGGRHLAIRATLPYELDTLRFNFESLSFFCSKAERQIVFELSIEERRFVETLRAINARSDLLLEKVEPKLSAAGFLDGVAYESNDFVNALGQPLYKALERLTNDVVSHVDRNNESILEMKDRIRSIAKLRFPKEKFVDFDFPDDQPAP
jgi:hypothetical protein